MSAIWLEDGYNVSESVSRVSGLREPVYTTAPTFPASKFDSSMFTAKAIEQAKLDAERLEEAYRKMMARKVFVLSSYFGDFMIVRHDDYKKWQMFVVRGRLAVVKREAFIEYELKDIATLDYFGKVKWFDCGYECDESTLRMQYEKFEPKIEISYEMFEDDGLVSKRQFRAVQGDVIDKMSESIMRSIYRPTV